MQSSRISQALIAALELRSCLPSKDFQNRFANKPTVYLNTNSDEPPIVIDTGASVTLSPTSSDFVGLLRPPSIHSLQGLKGSVNIVGEGTVSWKIKDAVGNVRVLQTTAFYVPSAPIRLFSPQAYFREHRSGSITLDQTGAKLILADHTHLQFPYQNNNLPLMFTSKHFEQHTPDVSLSETDLHTLSSITDWSGMLNVTDDRNRNLKPAQRELKLLHDRLGHADMQQIQTLCVTRDGNDPIIPTQHPKVSSCLRPLCATCRMANANRTNPEVTRSIPLHGATIRCDGPRRLRVHQSVHVFCPWKTSTYKR